MIASVGDPINGLLYLALYCLLQSGHSVISHLADDDPLPSLELLLRDPQVNSHLKVLPDIYRVLDSTVSQLSRISTSLYCLEIMLDCYAELQTQQGLSEEAKPKQAVHNPEHFNAEPFTAEVRAIKSAGTHHTCWLPMRVCTLSNARVWIILACPNVMLHASTLMLQCLDHRLGVMRTTCCLADQFSQCR
jgi:hypothetical protein